MPRKTAKATRAADDRARASRAGDNRAAAATGADGRGRRILRPDDAEAFDLHRPAHALP